MTEDNVDEKVVKWNDIFEKLLIDVRTLTKDLSDSIGYVAVSGVMTMLVGTAALAMGFIRGFELGPELGMRYIAFGAIMFFTCFVFGSTILMKWYSLRLKYERLAFLQRDMESS